MILVPLAPEIQGLWETSWRLKNHPEWILTFHPKHFLVRLSYSLCCDPRPRLLAHRPLSAQQCWSHDHLESQWLLSSTSSQFWGNVFGKPNNFPTTALSDTFDLDSWCSRSLSVPACSLTFISLSSPSKCFHQIRVDSRLHFSNLLSDFSSFKSDRSWGRPDHSLVLPAAELDCAYEVPLGPTCVPLKRQEVRGFHRDWYRVLLWETNFWYSGSP